MNTMAMGSQIDDALARNWSLMLIRGVCAIGFGVITFVWPGATISAIILLFGAFMLVDGVFLIGAAIKGKKAGYHWWPLLLEGVVGVLIGIYTFMQPAVAGIALLVWVAVWAIVGGVMQVVAAIKLRKLIEGEFWLGLAGVLAIAFGCLLIMRPIVGAVSLVRVLGWFAIFYGVILVLLAFKLKKFVGSLAGMPKAA